MSTVQRDYRNARGFADAGRVSLGAPAAPPATITAGPLFSCPLRARFLTYSSAAAFPSPGTIRTLLLVVVVVVVVARRANPDLRFGESILHRAQRVSNVLNVERHSPRIARPDVP